MNPHSGLPRRALLLGPLLAVAAPARAYRHPATLRPPVVGLMRQAGGEAPAQGAPSIAADCDTSVVLTEDGREEMRRFGARLRAGGVAAARLFASRRCSAWETATLLGLGPVRHSPVLDPYAPAQRAARREALHDLLIASGSGEEPVILVTHRANITDLTGIDLSQGDILLLNTLGGRLTMAGRITSD